MGDPPGSKVACLLSVNIEGRQKRLLTPEENPFEGFASI